MMNEEITIGKDVIETLTLGMYEDSLFVYREYIQNSADAIDKAFRDGLFYSKKDGQIDISIDNSNQSITIEDNATGIPSTQFLSLLRNIALSEKDRKTDKGFRGIGRLGGLAYCKELIFESKCKGESEKNILVWNAEQLKNIINDRNDKKNASQVILEITNHRTEKCDIDSHYFRVTMLKVNQTDLLNSSIVSSYLSLTAPVPFNAKFIFKEKIHKKIDEEQLCLDEYNIYVNHDQIYKSYKTRIYRSDNGNKGIKQAYDEIHDIEFFDIKQHEKGIAWGWYGLSTFNGVIHAKENPERGIRLRKGNIQLGDESTLLKLFKEKDRGNNYFIGEIHLVDPELIPNARRDYIIENSICKHLEKNISEKFEKLSKLVRTASDVRSSASKIENFTKTKEEYILKNKEKGFVNNDEKRVIEEKLKKEKEIAEQAKRKIDKIVNSETGQNNKVITAILKQKEKTSQDDLIIPISDEKNYLTDSLTKLSKEERKFVSKIYTIIKTNCPPHCSTTLIEKIQEAFKK